MKKGKNYAENMIFTRRNYSYHFKYLHVLDFCSFKTLFPIISSKLISDCLQNYMQHKMISKLQSIAFLVQCNKALSLQYVGSEKFNDAIELMIGYRINKWFHICWKYITPLVCTVSVKYYIIYFI